MPLDFLVPFEVLYGSSASWTTGTLQTIYHFEMVNRPEKEVMATLISFEGKAGIDTCDVWLKLYCAALSGYISTGKVDHEQAIKDSIDIADKAMPKVLISIPTKFRLEVEGEV